MSDIILAIDQGTTSSRVFLFDTNGCVVAEAQKKHQQHYPKQHWVEHDANEIIANVEALIKEVAATVDKQRIKCVGITNQRETIVAWHKQTGEVLAPAIVWQDQRTAKNCQQLNTDETFQQAIQEKTGLLINPYFSASKIQWLLEHNESVKQAAQANELAIGTIDTFLIYRLSQGKAFVTDVTNASRTLLFNIHTLDWDDELLEKFSVSRSMLPDVKACAAHFADMKLLDSAIPITGVAGDQHAALVGQQCFNQNQAKMTFGTGGFFLLNLGETFQAPPKGLLTTVAYQTSTAKHYAIEGSTFHAASIINWLQQLTLINEPAECDAICANTTIDETLIFLPAFNGLGAPHWRTDLQAMWHGLTLATSREQLVQSAVLSIALQTYDLLSALDKHDMSSLNVDGGVSHSDYILQSLANLTGLVVKRPKQLETTILGAMLLAGMGADLFPSLDSLEHLWQLDKQFEPQPAKQSSMSTVLQAWHAVMA